MNIESIKSELHHLLAMVDEWSAEGVASAIERDILLDRIKGLYEQLRFSQGISFNAPSTPPMDMEEESTAPEVEVELTYYEGDDEEDEEEQKEEEQKEDDKEDQELEETPLITFSLEDITILPEAEPDAEPEPEPTTPSSSKTENSLFDLDTIPVRQRSRRSAILSLYSDTPLPQKESKKETPSPEPEPTPTPTPTPTPSPEPAPIPLDIVDEIFMEDDAEEPQSVEIAAGVEVVNNNTQSIFITQEPAVETIADHYAANKEDITVSDKAIGRSSINDRYTIAQDLFAGEMSGYETLMRKLSEIDNFEDCMIYITENYDWDADQDAVKLVVKLLEQRFSIS